MNNTLRNYIHSLQEDIAEIPDGRKKSLGELADIIRSIWLEKKTARLTFICTHNSRRSHMCQVWAATLADHFGLNNLDTYSGGTEQTAFNPRAVEAIKRAGFTVEDPGGKNPHYKVFYDEHKEPLVCFSKTFDHQSNPENDFIAVMTCSDADQNCPIVPGASSRVTLPYEDPKQADGTPQESQIYDQRCRQIAAEMYYMLAKLN